VLSNTLGTLSFADAGPDTRSTQLYVNLGDNSGLDSQGFSPFGTVTAGMDVFSKIYAGYGQNPDQDSIYSQGNAYLKKSFPKLSYSTTVVLE
jgi:peptidyl-prolyl cis-trans isomerase A (cyclophilin A)